jgi:hypothetical protein
VEMLACCVDEFVKCCDIKVHSLNVLIWAVQAVERKVLFRFIQFPA